VDRIAEAFTWPFRDPDWLPKLASLDRLRAGEDRLAPANFSHLGRGIRLFAVEVIYAICIGLVALVIFLPAVALAVQQGQGSANSALIAGAIFLNLLGFSAITVLSLALTFATPAIVLATDSGGIGGGIRVGAMLRRSRMNLSHTLIAGLMLIAASFVGSLGAALCGIGIVVTSAYALAMQAWIIRSFEKG